VKYLGLEIDIDGSGKTQFLTTKTTARKLAAVISTRVASPTVKYAVARSSTMAKLAYPLRFSCWRLSKYYEIDQTLSAVFRRSTRNTRAFPTELIYLPTKLGGLGLKRLSDIVQLDKWATIQRMLRGNSHFHTVALGLVHQGFRKANIHPPKDTTTIYYP